MLRSLFTPTLLLLFCQSAMGQGQPYSSPFSSSYQYTTDSLVQHPPTTASGQVNQPATTIHESLAPGGQPVFGQPVASDTVASPPFRQPGFHTQSPAHAVQPMIAGNQPIFSGHQPNLVAPPLFNDGQPYCTECPPSSGVVGPPFSSPSVSGHSGTLTPYSAPAWNSSVLSSDTCQQAVCDACVCSPCDESGRKFAFDVNSVFMFRDRPNGQLLFFNPGVAAERIDASEFSPGGAYGLESAFIIYDQKSFTDFEFRTLWLNDWDSNVAESFTGVSVQMASNPVLGTTGPRIGASFYGSQLGSMELNARYRRRRVTLFGGLRHIRLDENLNSTLRDPAGIVPDELIRSSTDNRLYGLQLGMESVVANRDRCCLKVSGRVGILGNDTDQGTQLISLSSPPVTFTSTGQGGELALLAEGGVSGKIKLTSCANLIAGYRVIYLDGLALATEQLAASNFLTRAGIHHNGSLLLHAVNVGVEVAY